MSGMPQIPSSSGEGYLGVICAGELHLLQHQNLQEEFCKDWER